MKKFDRIAMSVLLATVTTGMFTSCTNNDDSVLDNNATENIYTITVDANMAAGDANLTRALSLNGITLKSTWESTDRIKVYYKNKAVGTLSPTSSGDASTTLSGTLSFASDALPNKSYKLMLYYPDKDVSYEGQDGTLATIAANTDCAQAEVSMTNIDNTNKTITAGVAAFTKQQAIVKFTLKDKDGNSINASKFTICDSKRNLIATNNGSATTNGFIAVTSSSATDEYYVALSGVSESDLSLSVVIGSDVYNYYRSNVTFNNGNFYAVTVKMEKMGEGIQLWDGGPYWAENNLPGYYQWAAVFPNNKCDRESCPYYDKVWKWTGYRDVGATLNIADDAARQQWGFPWRMPTIAEFKALAENTTYTIYSAGILLTGKGSYSDKSIFLPYTGYWAGSSTLYGDNTGHYWSSSQSASITAYACQFGFSTGAPSTSDTPPRTRGCAIRPVHD